VLLNALRTAGPLPCLKSLDAAIAGGMVDLACLPQTLESISLDALGAQRNGTLWDDTSDRIAAALSRLTSLRSLSLLCMPDIQRCLPEPGVMSSCWLQLTSVLLRCGAGSALPLLRSWGTCRRRCSSWRCGTTLEPSRSTLSTR
jgi:hypothetical protein